MTKNTNKEITNYLDAYVGYKVKMRRLTLGISQKELSSAINISVEQLKKHEQGSSKIYSGTLYRISQFLNVPVSYFFDEVADNIQTIFSIKESASMRGVSVDEKDIFSLIKIYTGLGAAQYSL